MLKSKKTKAWDAMARFIRAEECLASTGYWFVGYCITCGRRNHINNLDAGHFVSGRRNAVLLVRENVHIQCHHWCNVHKNGNPKIYREKMVELYGEEKVVEIEALKNKIIQDKDMDFEGVEKEYTEKLKALEKEHGFKFGEKPEY